MNANDIRIALEIPWYVLYPILALLGGFVFCIFKLFDKHTSSNQAVTAESRFCAKRLAESEYFVRKVRVLFRVRLDLATADSARIPKMVKFTFRHPDAFKALNLAKMERVGFVLTNQPLKRVPTSEECAFLRLKEGLWK